MRGRWLPASVLFALVACGRSEPAPARGAAAEAAPVASDDDRAVLATLKGAKRLLALRGKPQLVAYRNLDQLTPVNVVPRGDHVEPLPDAPRDFSAFTYSYQDRARTIDEFMDAMNVVGLLVLVDGTIALERYADGNTVDTRWTSFSVTKSVVSLLFGAALEDGHIKDLDASVVDYVPELAGSAYDQVTLRHLLQMASGVRWADDEMEDIVRLTTIREEGGFPAQLAYMKTLPRRAPAGTVFKYSTHEADLAGAVLKAATGRTLSEYLSETIWKRFGMQADGYWVRLPGSDLEYGGCCLSATLRDYGRIGLVALRDGVAHDGTRLVPEGWIAESTRPSTAAKHYGYYWWLGANGRYFASGLFGQHIEVAPAERVVVAIQSYWPEGVTDELTSHNDAFVAALVTAAAVAPAAR